LFVLFYFHINKEMPRISRTRRNAVHENMENFDHNSIERSRAPAPIPYKGKKKPGMEDCPICLKEYTENEEVVMLHGPTGPKHTMCVSCFESYSSRGTPNKCPICRQSVYSVASSFGKCVYMQRVKGKKSRNLRSSFGNANLKLLFSLVKKSSIKDCELEQIVELYNSLDGNVSITDKDSNTPLMVASNVSTVDTLLRKTSESNNINHKNKTGKTSLFINISKPRPNYNIMKSLIGLGADPNIFDNEGNSPLIHIIKKYKTPSKNIQIHKPLEYILENSNAVLNHADLLEYAESIGAKPAIKIIKKFTPSSVVQTFDLDGLGAALPRVSSRRTSLEDMMGNLNVKNDPYNLGGISDALPSIQPRKTPKRRLSFDPLNMNDLEEALPKAHKMNEYFDPFNLNDLGAALPVFNVGRAPTPSRKKTPRRSKRIQNRNISQLDKLMDNLGMFGRKKKPADKKKRAKSTKSKSKRRK
jgi:hypothetical protein